MPSRADIETTLGHLALFACTGLWFGEPNELRTLVNHIADLEADRTELRERVKELEVYEEREMIGDPAGLGGPSISDSIRDRNAAQAEAENIRYQLDWANERIRDLENNIRSHKRVCPMFR